MIFALPLLLGALLSQAGPTPTPVPNPSPTPTGLVYYGKPAVRFALDARPLGFDADGNAQWLLVSKFFDAQGRPTRIMANSDIDWTSHDGYVQWQTRLRYGQPSAILKTHRNGPLSMTVRANQPALGTQIEHADTRTWRGPRVLAQAVGPREIQIGWFPQENRMTRIVRVNGDGTRRTLAVIAGPSSTYRDSSVLPGTAYRYIVYRSGYPAVSLRPVPALPAPPATAIDNAAGKAMWLYFTANPTDAIYYKHLNPQHIVDQAIRAGLHYVELRTAYGAYWEITPEAKPTIDAIIDGLAAHGIGTIGWSVPRDLTVEDLAASVKTAYYRTAKGTPFTGLAIDLERGDEFMGGDPNGLNALWMYASYLREALGPHYLIVSTVEDPYLEHLDNLKYPYPQIAKYSDVLQPMSYWRMMRREPTTPEQVRVLLKSSYDRLLYLSGRKLPVSMGGQTDSEGRNGFPPADEITASLDVSKQVGAIGECFFAWDATQPYQWDAIGTYRW
ncbi:MAG TPA: hypothetical protein VFE17_01140 [Candidatus Baltobacteraceae bacterium]|jgi:hypothetical protein|nr:hypothetical protein [Candidatus Baltobacteraceae bacterium]